MGRADDGQSLFFKIQEMTTTSGFSPGCLTETLAAAVAAELAADNGVLGRAQVASANLQKILEKEELQRKAVEIVG